MNPDQMRNLMPRKPRKAGRLPYLLLWLSIIGAGAYNWERFADYINKPVAERLEGKYAVVEEDGGKYIKLPGSDREYWLGRVMPERGDTRNGFIRGAFAESNREWDFHGDENILSDIVWILNKGEPMAGVSYTTITDVVSGN
tara:strand:- start:372 stop:797 length:426 start_codon:yes stop_codon:yes gene_type:complete